MKNPTVRDLIELLSECNPDDMVCYKEGKHFYTFEEFYTQDNVKFIDDEGFDRIGNIIVIN